MVALAVMFTRRVGSEPEKGIAVSVGDSHNVMAIIDSTGKSVGTELWTYTLTPHEGCIVVDIPVN
jgi:hypothetical protein